MKKLTKQEIDRLSETIINVEKETDAEIVTVVASKSDSYLYIPTLWAGIVALLVPLILKITPLWLSGDELLILQWITFVLLAAIFRIPAVMMRLLPKSVKHWRASNMARRQFLDNNLHHTKDETGVLIFMSEAEHYVEILADRGIDKHIDQSQWQSIVDELTGSIKQGNTQEGLDRCIVRCGEILKEYAPATSTKDELPNRIVILN